jgi:UDP-N-acetylglucosamine 1-carboxyvinyltransferase
MEKLIVKGGASLSGEVKISKAKNAYLPLLSAVLLTEEEIIFEEVPNLRDIHTMNKLLGYLAVEVKPCDNGYSYVSSNNSSCEATYDLVKTMRASICVLGPLLARFKKAKVSLPGGCAIGTRPIDLHLKNLEKMGAIINIDAGYVEAHTEGLVGANISLDFPSVGATENIMMAATLAKGQTVIDNAALEPEITDLGDFLNAIGAKVTGHGTSKIIIDGVAKLKGTRYKAIGDRIEAATYIIAGLMTGSNIKVTDFNPNHIDNVLEKLKSMGAKMEIGNDFVEVFPSKLQAATVDTAPFPGFPTDVQAQMMALMLVCEGTSIITENIFENRFMHVPEIQRLGAEIQLKGSSAMIKGGAPLTAAPVMCTDLRASAALVLAALCSAGDTEILRIYHLDRGYENLAKKLSTLGANITRVKTEEF